MSYFFKTFISLSMMVIMTNSKVFAYSCQVDGIYYNLNVNKATVTSGDVKYKGNVAIPKTITYKQKTYNVTCIGEGAFRGCDDLISVTIPSSVTSIGSEAFWSCDNLETVDMKPTTLQELGSHAFYSCNALKEIVVPKGVINIKRSTFENCKSLRMVSLPEGLKIIDSDAFANCSDLSSINFPSSIEEVGWQAFYGCRRIPKVDISHIKNIGYRAFNGCDAIEAITIPEGITKIEGQAFKGCRALNSISLPSSLTSLENEAFFGCEKLRSVKCAAINPPKIYKSVFDGEAPTKGRVVRFYYTGNRPDLSRVTLYVPKGSLNSYSKHPEWSKFGSIKEM